MGSTPNEVIRWLCSHALQTLVGTITEVAVRVGKDAYCYFVEVVANGNQNSYSAFHHDKRNPAVRYAVSCRKKIRRALPTVRLTLEVACG